MQIRKFFSPDAEGGYGYASDEVKVSPFSFGLNAGNTFLKKFEWIGNAGKDGAEAEAIDIVFNINGTDKSYRKFPVNKVYDKNNNELTDVNTEEYKKAKQEAMTDFNATLVHILHAFLDDDVLKQKLSRPFKSFKEYAQFLQSLLPQGFDKVALDIFLQYQWQPSPNQSRTFLEIPKKMKYGAWLKPAQPGTWTEHKLENPTEKDRKALWYTNEEGTEHPFTKNGWFMLSNFANMQGSGESGASEAADNMNAGTTEETTSDSTSGGAMASGW